MPGKFEISINRKWCKNCGICVAYCPKNVLLMSEKKVLVIQRQEDCSGCRMCEYRCPDLAITVETPKVV